MAVARGRRLWLRQQVANRGNTFGLVNFAAAAPILFQARSRTPLTCHVRNGSGAEALGLIHNSKAFGYRSQEGLPKMRNVSTQRHLGLLK